MTIRRIGSAGRRRALVLVMGGAVLAAPALAVSTFAQSGPPTTSVPGFHHDTHQPIKITADKLEVEQNQEIATFTGNVIAIQGAMRLRADTLKVHYHGNRAAPARGGADPAVKPVPQAAAGAGQSPMGAISELDAYGHVFLLAPGETAQGAVGVYDVEKHVIVLTGKPVVLTRGKNVLTGQKVAMNLDTGMSVLTPEVGGRVHGLFVPEQGNGKPDAKKPGVPR